MAREPVRRPDFNQSVVHLTRERREFEDPLGLKVKSIVPAFDVLKEIIKSGVIRAGSGYIKGNREAVCFSEIPLSSVHEFAKPATEDGARYRFYGVALSKRTVFGLGGRPVIYIPDQEGDWIPEEQKWRQVRFEYDVVDFTHEREWRVPGDVELTKVPGIYILVWSASEARELYQFASPISQLIRGILPMEHITTML